MRWAGRAAGTRVGKAGSIPGFGVLERGCQGCTTLERNAVLFLRMCIFVSQLW